MMDLLFGPHRSWQRHASMVLCLIIILFGIAIAVTGKPAGGIGVVLFGLVTGTVLARVGENLAARQATSELLNSMSGTTGEMEAARLKSMVAEAKSVTPTQHPRVESAEPLHVEDVPDAASLPYTDEAPSQT